MNSRFGPTMRRPSQMLGVGRLSSACLIFAAATLWGHATRAQDFDQPLPPAPLPVPRASVLTRAPTLKKEVTPVYPPQALAARLTADVKMTIDIDAEGRVTAATVSEPSGGGARTTIGSALCDGAPTRIDIAADVDLGGSPSIVAHLDPAFIMNAFAQDVFTGPDGHIHGGFDLGMPIVFQVTARAGDETVSAIKRAVFWASPVNADQRPNITPEISGVTVYAERDETTAEPLPGAVQPLVDGAAAIVPAKGLWVDPAPADAEAYTTPVLDRNTSLVIPHPVAAETLTYTFFATAGTFSPFETKSEPAPGVSVQTRVHIESKYEPPAATSASTDVTIWIVVRDERGAASWVTRTLQVEAVSPSGSRGAGP